MEYHSEVRSMGVVGKVLKENWTARDASAVARGAGQLMLMLVVSAIGRQLKGWGNSVSPALPKEARRVSPPARRGTRLPEPMIKPSMHHRVVIASRRDDWP